LNFSNERTTAENQICAKKIKKIIVPMEGGEYWMGLMSYEPFQEKDKPSINVALMWFVVLGTVRK
jgi:hypothetical protein